MKRIFAVMALCAAVVIGATSCKKQTGEALPAATEKRVLRVEKFEGFERGKGLSGDLLLSVSNGFGSNVTLTDGTIVVKYGEKAVCTLTLTEEVKAPKRVVSSVRVPVALEFSSPVISYGLISKIVRGEFNKMTVTVDANAKAGIMRKHIYHENIPLREALRAINLPTDMIKGFMK